MQKLNIKIDVSSRALNTKLSYDLFTTYNAKYTALHRNTTLLYFHTIKTTHNVLISYTRITTYS